MNTNLRVKTSDKVQAAFELGFKKGAIASHLGISRNTLKARLKDNFWYPSELEVLKILGIL